MAKRHANTQRVIDEIKEAPVLSDVEVLDKRTNSLKRVNQYGLTDKQEGFARGVANGLTLKEAYVRSYDASDMKTGTIYAEASRLMDNPAVSARVRVLLADRQENTHANDAKRIRQHVFDRLMIESVDDESPPAARIKALELLGKIDVVSMFREQKGEVIEPTDIEGLEAKLRVALGKLIDISPVRDRKSNGADDEEE
jgi:hypothetical protein